MRRGSQPKAIYDKNGQLMAVNLGADYCAEHEHGLESLEFAFDLDPSATPGVPRRQISVLPNGMVLDQQRLTIGYDGQRYWRQDEAIDNDEIRLYPKEAELAGAWSDRDFAVRFAKTAKGKAAYGELAAAFTRLDIAFLTENVGDNPFARAGLVLAIASRLPAAITDSLREQTEDADALAAAAATTGIESKIEAASMANANGRGFERHFALSPRWKDESKQEVVFWLNPMDQKRNNRGLFTVADLEAWLVGKGPIPIPQPKCEECGSEIDLRKEGFAKDDPPARCASCRRWLEMTSIRRENRSVRVAGVQYLLTDRAGYDKSPKPVRIRFTDAGRRPRADLEIETDTNRLMRMGEIPARFRDRLPDNAVFMGQAL